MEWKRTDIPDLKGKIVVVTGATSSTGFEACRTFANNGARVIMASGSLENAEEAARNIIGETLYNNVVAMKLDLADLDSVKSFAAEYIRRFPRLDILLNNATVFDQPLNRTIQGFEMHLGANYLGHFLLTARLIDIINQTPGSRIVNVTGIHKLHRINFEDINWDESYSKNDAYGQSKAANILFTFELDRRLKEAAKNTIAVAVHSGEAGTQLVRKDHELEGSPSKLMRKLSGRRFSNKVEEAVLPLLFASTSPEVTSGRFYGPDFPMEQVVNPDIINYDDAERLWEISEKLTGIDFYISREGQFEPARSGASGGNNGYRF